MRKMTYVLYLLTYFSVPFSKWRSWRRRRALFQARKPIELDKWVRTFGEGNTWNLELSKMVLDNLETLIVDPRRVRPSDGLTQEFAVPSEKLQESLWGDFWTCIEFSLKETYDISEMPPPQHDLLSGTVNDLISYLHTVVSLNSLDSEP